MTSLVLLSWCGFASCVYSCLCRSVSMQTWACGGLVRLFLGIFHCLSMVVVVVAVCVFCFLCACVCVGVGLSCKAKSAFSPNVAHTFAHSLTLQYLFGVSLLALSHQHQDCCVIFQVATIIMYGKDALAHELRRGEVRHR